MHLLTRQVLGHSRSLNCGRCDEVGGDPIGRQLECDEPDKLVQCRLGGAQRNHAVAGPAGQPRAEIDQPTVAAGNHCRHNGFRYQECGTQLANDVMAKGINALCTSTSTPPHRRSISPTMAVTSSAAVTSA